MTKEKIKLLADLTAQKTAIDDILKLKRDEFAKTIEADSLRSADLTKQISAVKAELSTEAKADFTADPEKNKTRDGGIKIQESKALEYDSAAALNFAKEKDMFLALDVKSFEKAAPGMGLDFVKVVPVLKVAFPKTIKMEAN